MKETPPLEIHDMTVAYHRKPVLWDIDVAVPEGKLVGVLGPNGAGKSTLIKAALGLIPRASGDVYYFGDSYQKMRNRIGYVPQRETVDWDFPVSVLDVVLMGTYGRLPWCVRPGDKEREIARTCLDQVGLTRLADRQIRQLSGGQQQRTFLARALAQDADLYFMDEPFAGVDMATEEAIVELLHTMRQQGKTVLVVHHDLQTVAQYFDYVIMLNMRVVAAGPVETTFTSDNLGKTFGGRLNILDAAAEAVRKGT